MINEWSIWKQFGSFWNRATILNWLLKNRFMTGKDWIFIKYYLLYLYYLLLYYYIYILLYLYYLLLFYYIYIILLYYYIYIILIFIIFYKLFITVNGSYYELEEKFLKRGSNSRTFISIIKKKFVSFSKYCNKLFYKYYNNILRVYSNTYNILRYLKLCINI